MVLLPQLSSSRWASMLSSSTPKSVSVTIGVCDIGKLVPSSSSPSDSSEVLTDVRSLSLHDPVSANHLPFIPFPATWPLYTPAGKLANFLESYVEILELNVWSQATVDPSRTKFNASTNSWDVTIVRTLSDGSRVTRQFTVSHIVMATGLGGGQPKMPAPFPGQYEWDGVAVHSSKHATGADWKGKRALVVGACTSGHDVSTIRALVQPSRDSADYAQIAVDFAQNGVDVTMLQRTPTFVMSVDKGQALMGQYSTQPSQDPGAPSLTSTVSGLYNDKMPSAEYQDLLGESNPKFVVKLFHKRLIELLKVQDADLLEGLKKRNFKTWSGPENSGFIMSTPPSVAATCVRNWLIPL